MRLHSQHFPCCESPYEQLIYTVHVSECVCVHYGRCGDVTYINRSRFVCIELNVVLIDFCISVCCVDLAEADVLHIQPDTAVCLYIIRWSLCLHFAAKQRRKGETAAT